MVWSDDDLEGLVMHFEGGCSPFDNQERRIALAIFKELALRRLVDPTIVAPRGELSRSDLGITIQRWPGVWPDRWVQGLDVACWRLDRSLPVGQKGRGAT